MKYELAAGRRAYVHVIRGSIVANGTMLAAGDALKVSDESLVTLSPADGATGVECGMRPATGVP